MKSIEDRIVTIEKRNEKVELDKAWETSWIRRLSIAILTYIVIVAYLTFVIKNDRPFINAFVPVMGYLLSTLALSLIRDFWSSTQKKR